jgi:hypothetical protein
MKRVVTAALFACACAHAVTARQFKARYSHEGDNAPEAPQCAGFSKVDVHDARKDPKVVGDRANEEEQTSAPISLLNDSTQWVKDGIESQARNAQFLLGNPSSPVLDVTVNTIDMHEKVFSNGSYDARIVIDIALTSTAGQRCLTASFEGTGHNYGSPGDATNYAQTLNRALDAASARLLGNANLRDAACRCLQGAGGT